MGRFALLLVLASIARPLEAQGLDGLSVAARSTRHECTGCFGSPGVATQGNDRASAWSIVASAAVPGSGQAMLAVNRALPYLAVEVFAWAAYVRHSQRYRARRDDYRNLAARVARAPYAQMAPSGDFEYYERMTHYAESGRYDLIPGGRIDPETDSTTYNGAVWLLARRTFWSDPAVTPDTQSSEWQRALTFYQSRAYDQLYRWSWSQAPTEYDAFVDFIRQSNDANRRAMMDLGLVIANHVLSMVDAYITVRLRQDRSRGQFSLEAQVPLQSFRSK